MNIMIVAMFSTEGGISKDFVNIGVSLAQYADVYSVVNAGGGASQVVGEKGRLELSIGKNNLLGFFLPFNYIKLRKFAKENEIEKVYFFSHTPFNIFASCVLKKYDLYAYLHNPLPHKGTKWLIGKVEKITNRVITKRSKKVFVASNYQVELIKRDKFYGKYKNKIFCHYLGIQKSMIQELPKTEEDIDVLFFGRIEHYKGVEVLIKAIHELPMVRCVIIGKGSIGVDIPDNVELINRYVPDEEIVQFINRCKIGVLPYREATGTAIVQTFFWYKKPLVATNTGCLPEYVIDGRTGIIVEPENKRELKNAINKLLNDDEMRMNYGQNAYADLKRFDNDSLAKELIMFLNAE